jgi:hypothetical protein
MRLRGSPKAKVYREKVRAKKKLIVVCFNADILNPDVAANGREDNLIRHIKIGDNGVTFL